MRVSSRAHTDLIPNNPRRCPLKGSTSCGPGTAGAPHYAVLAGSETSHPGWDAPQHCAASGAHTSARFRKILQRISLVSTPSGSKIGAPRILSKSLVDLVGGGGGGAFNFATTRSTRQLIASLEIYVGHRFLYISRYPPSLPPPHLSVADLEQGPNGTM